MLAHPPLHRIQRRPLPHQTVGEFEAAMRKGWGFLRRVRYEVEDDLYFDEEANALLPYSAWYAVAHVGHAFGLASRQTSQHDHVALLRALGSTVVRRGLLPLPWGAWCEGCPQTDAPRFGGLAKVGSVHVLSAPSPDTAESRLGLVLRTTREKALEREFDVMRRQKVAKGRSRRNISRLEKEAKAAKFAPTTLFDFLYRLRLRASYGEADLFVLGARDEREARRFAEALVLVCDATVAALEALIAAYAGPAALADAAERYTDRTDSNVVAARASAWRERRAPQAPRLRARAPAWDDIPF